MGGITIDQNIVGPQSNKIKWLCLCNENILNLWIYIGLGSMKYPKYAQGVTGIATGMGQTSYSEPSEWRGTMMYRRVP